MSGKGQLARRQAVNSRSFERGPTAWFRLIGLVRFPHVWPWTGVHGSGTIDLEACAKALAKPMRLRRWRELHALYAATEPHIGGPNTARAPKGLFPERAFGP